MRPHKRRIVAIILLKIIIIIVIVIIISNTMYCMIKVIMLFMIHLIVS